MTSFHTKDAEFLGPVGAVLLIDADNDPHIPPDFPLTPQTLVRLFLRPGAKVPAALERRLGELPHCVAVSSPKGGANAADFVMSFHVGILHATLPLQVPFAVVTADKSLSVLVQELQRVGRHCVLWTSHPERGGRKPAEPRASASPRRPPSRRPRRGSGRKAAAEAPPAAPVVESATAAPAPVGERDPRLADVAGGYARRLAKIKGPPSRLKTLLNDIANRTKTSGFEPQAILEELKRSHGLKVDEKGKVSLGSLP